MDTIANDVLRWWSQTDRGRPIDEWDDLYLNSAQCVDLPKGSFLNDVAVEVTQAQDAVIEGGEGGGIAALGEGRRTAVAYRRAVVGSGGDVRQMGVTIEEQVDGGRRGHVVGVEHMAVGEEDAVLAVADQGIGAHDGEGEEHLVNLAVAVAADGHDVGGEGLQAFHHAGGIQSVGQTIARSIVEDVAEQEQHVVCLFMKERQDGVERRDRTVYVGENEKFHGRSAFVRIDGGAQVAAVVRRGHHLAIGAGRAEGDKVAALRQGQHFALGKDVAALADGAYHIVGSRRLFAALFGGEVLNGVMRAVHGRADEFGEAGIDDDELLGMALLDVDGSGNEGATLRHDGASGLKVHLLALAYLQVLGDAANPFVERRDGVGIGRVVIDAQAATQIDGGRRDAVGFEHGLYLVHAPAERLIDLKVKNLTADMEVEAAVAHIGHGLRALDAGQQVLNGDAKFILVQTGRNLGMGMGIDVGVDAEGHGGYDAHLGGEGVDDFQFGQTFHIEAADAGLERGANLLVRFTYAGKDDAVGREAAGHGLLYLATTDTVGTEAGLREALEDARIGIGLDGIVDVEVRVGGKGRLQTIDGAPEQRHVVVVAGRGGLCESLYRKGHG